MRSYVVGGCTIEISSKTVIEEELKKQLKSDWNALCNKIEPKATLLVQRLMCNLDALELRYNVVEYPQGDIYTVASAYSMLLKDHSLATLRHNL